MTAIITGIKIAENGRTLIKFEDLHTSGFVATDTCKWYDTRVIDMLMDIVDTGDMVKLIHPYNGTLYGEFERK